MARTMLLDRSTWDLVIDANGNIATATAPYSLAQDAASACRTFLGECWYNTGVGVPLWNVLGQLPPLSLMKQYFVNAAMTVPGVVAAQVFLSISSGRVLGGQIQVTDANGVITAAAF